MFTSCHLFVRTVCPLPSPTWVTELSPYHWPSTTSHPTRRPCQFGPAKICSRNVAGSVWPWRKGTEGTLSEHTRHVWPPHNLPCGDQPGSENCLQGHHSSQEVKWGLSVVTSGQILVLAQWGSLHTSGSPQTSQLHNDLSFLLPPKGRRKLSFPLLCGEGPIFSPVKTISLST